MTSSALPDDLAAAAAEAAARRSYGKLVAFLAARTRDVAGAEDALADAFAAALADWPAHGVPRVPEAWLLTVARRRLIDAARSRASGEAAAAHAQWLAELGADEDDERAAALVPDERLALMFACAHPAIERGARAPLMLQTILGFDSATIASAFLVQPGAMSQRLVRAKSRLRAAGVPFRVPEARGELRGERLEAVLDAIYAAFAEGWADPTGTEARERNLTEEAVWLARLVAALLPEEPEALGLLALVLHAHARRDARRDERGEYVPLAEQRPERWDAALIDEAEALLRQASRSGRAGRFQLEAALQSAHVAGRRHGEALTSDWPAIVRLYDALLALAPSPVVATNRAVALARVDGAAAGLAALDALCRDGGDGALADYQPYWAARAELLAGVGEASAADAAYARAIGLERDPAVRRFLQGRRCALVTGPAPGPLLSSGA